MFNVDMKFRSLIKSTVIVCFFAMSTMFAQVTENVLAPALIPETATVLINGIYFDENHPKFGNPEFSNPPYEYQNFVYKYWRNLNSQVTDARIFESVNSTPNTSYKLLISANRKSEDPNVMQMVLTIASLFTVSSPLKEEWTLTFVLFDEANHKKIYENTFTESFRGKNGVFYMTHVYEWENMFSRMILQFKTALGTSLNINDTI